MHASRVSAANTHPWTVLSERSWATVQNKGTTHNFLGAELASGREFYVGTSKDLIHSNLSLKITCSTTRLRTTGTVVMYELPFMHVLSLLSPSSVNCYFWISNISRPCYDRCNNSCDLSYIHFIHSFIPKDMYCLLHSTISLTFLHVHHIPHSTKATRTAEHIVFVIQLSHPLLVHGLPNHLFHILISLIVHVFH